MSKLIACENSGHRIENDFPEVRKIVEAGANKKPIKDYELSRYACYLMHPSSCPSDKKHRSQKSSLNSNGLPSRLTSFFMFKARSNRLSEFPFACIHSYDEVLIPVGIIRNLQTMLYNAYVITRLYIIFVG